nr:hypothetical protein [Neorhizobium tomejilense]
MNSSIFFSRFTEDLGEAVLKQDHLKIEIMREAFDRATGVDRSKSGTESSEEETERLIRTTAPTPEELRGAIRSILEALRVSSTARAKRSFEVLQPYLD